MTNEPKLRGRSHSSFSPWTLGEIPDKVIKSVGKNLVHFLAIGKKDITGDDFGDIFANAVKGIHYSSPLGLADVAFNGTCWSVKTVKAEKPSKQERVRLISGRNSPDFSLGIENAHQDIQNTGKAVLAIWNKRLNEARGQHDDVRVVVLIRNMGSKEFILFEEEITRYVAGDYVWKLNKNNNLQGHRKADDKHVFTWQFHGSQFTIIREVPSSAIRFCIRKNVPLVEPLHIYRIIKYNDEWIEIG